MLWLALYLPRLALEVFERGTENTALPGLQLAVCDRLQVLLASSAAEAQGVRSGIKRATALALAPALILLERDPPREQQALEQLACWLLQFTPSVSLQSPLSGPQRLSPGAATRRQTSTSRRAGILLEVEPSLNLFGGLDALTRTIRNGLLALGFDVQIACAPTARGAWLLALLRDGAVAVDTAQLHSRLADLPLGVLDAAAPHSGSFESMGIHTFKQLLMLPRAGLARRFGHELLAEIDQALGTRADPRGWFEAPASFAARLELLADIENAEALLFAAHRLLIQMSGWMTALQAGARAFELLCEHDGHPATAVAVRMTEPSRDCDRMTGLLRERLTVTQLPAPVHTLVLSCRDVSLLALPNQELFPTPRSSQESLARLIERLQARLGRQQIQRICVAEDHRPEAAYRIEEIDDLFTPSIAKRLGTSPTTRQATASVTTAPLTTAPVTTTQVPNTSLPRPLWLLPSPIPIGERSNRPYWRSALNLLAGPERIESGWWDGALVQRDYFIAEDEAHVLYWIYRERLGSTNSQQGWFVQGRFG